MIGEKQAEKFDRINKRWNNSSESGKSYGGDNPNIRTGVVTDDYRDNYDRIFKKEEKK